MTFHKNRFLTTVSAIALVLAVGACSSSGDDETMMNGAATNGEGAATNGEGAATNGEGAATNGDGDAANGDDDTKTPAQTLAAAEKALTDASTDEDRAAAMTALVAALKLEGNEAAYVAYLEKKVDDQAQTVADAAAKKVSDMAKKVLAAIRVNTDLGEVIPDAAPAAVKLAASSAGELTATLEGYTMSAAPEEIAGWRGSTLKKDGDTTVIYTNIKDEVPTSLDVLYARASALPLADQTYPVTNDGDLKTIEWADVKRADMRQVVTPADTNAVPATMALTTFAGSVRGVDGTFSCEGANCPVPTPVDGKITDGGTGWTFAPTESGAMINVKDTAYVSFGWWLNAVGTKGEYVFDAFASAATGMTARAVETTVDGSATYKGAAAGKYAMQSTIDSSASGGHFTANATLTADFDASTDPTNALANELGVSIGGKIDGFMTGDVSRPNWEVTLTGPAADTEILVGGVEGTTSWTTGGAVPGTGSWSAVFYGSEKDTGHPTDVTGEFNAAIGGDDDIARIAGAFAATK